MCMNRTLGVTFSKSSQWHTHQRDLIKTIEDQIEAVFPNDINLLINMTWFGPHITNQ